MEVEDGLAQLPRRGDERASARASAGWVVAVGRLLELVAR